ncbi:MAG: NAD-dependent epimerase/dehydratase family protein [Acidobacteriota bacterium]
MRVLITGGAGFIGSHVVTALLARGDEVVVLDDLSSGCRENLAELPARLVVGDICDEGAVRGALTGCEAVVHLAAEVSVTRSVEQPEQTQRVNDQATRELLTASQDAGVRRFVLASSCAVYGDNDREEQEEAQVPAPTSPYAVTKLAGERHVAAAAADGMGAIALRFFNVYGERQDPGSEYAAVIARFTQAMVAGEAPTVYGDGRQTRDFVHVGDVARACLLALEAAPAAWGRAFNVGRGESISINRLLSVLGDLCEQAPGARYEGQRPGDLRHSRASVLTATEALGFTAAVTLEEGLRRLVGDFRERQATTG